LTPLKGTGIYVMKRTRELTIRMTDDELAAVRAKAAARGVGMADLARKLLADAEDIEVRPTRRRRGVAPARGPAPTADPALVREVARIGNNVNQLARWANTRKSGVEAVEVLVELAALDRDVMRLLDSDPETDPEGRADDD